MLFILCIVDGIFFSASNKTEKKKGKKKKKTTYTRTHNIHNLHVLVHIKRKKVVFTFKT